MQNKVMVQRVLLVDDDPEEIELLTEAMAEIAPAVTCAGARNGLVALRLLDSEPKSLPDLILLDINMPVMNGWEFLQRLRATEKLKSLPVVIYSTTDRWQDKERADTLGAAKFIKKPDTYTELKKELEALVRGVKMMAWKMLPLIHTVRCYAGRLIKNVVPIPGSLSARIEPL